MTAPSLELRTANRGPGRSRRTLLIIGLAVILVPTCMAMGGLASILTPIPTLLLLVVLYLPVVAWAARSEPDRRLAKLMWVGYGARLVGYAARYMVITNVYGTGDAKSYHRAGAELARSYRRGDFGAPVPGGGGGQGTMSVRVITGYIYSVTGSTLLVGALVFTLLSFSGVLLLVKAFRIGVPAADHLRYGRLLLLLPSLWFWPSSIGKEAWMLFGIGVLAYGAARLYARAPGGLVLIAAGATACAYVRPHIALVATAAAAVALVFRSRHQARRFNRLGKILILVPLVFGGLILLTRSQEFLQVDELSVSQVQSVGQRAGEQTGQGGSAFTPVPVHGVQQLPMAAVTVLFRPFPMEAKSALSLAIGLEGAFLLLLAVLSWRRVLAALRALRRSPYLVLCATATVAYIIAFSSFANFGILARERVQVLPFFLAFLAATQSPRSPAGRIDARSGQLVPPPAPARPTLRNLVRWRAPDGAGS